MKKISDYLPTAVTVVFIIKWLYFFSKGRYFEAVGWPLVWGWVFWVAYAFKNNKEMPAYSGDFDYKNGANQTARAFYLVAIVICFFVVAVVG